MKRTKRIQEIAPLLADNFTDFEPSQDLWKLHGELVETNKSRLGNYYKYIIQLHDSRIIEAKKKNSDFEIILNDFSRFVFVKAIVDKKNLKINHSNFEFPLILKFKNADISLNKISEEGILEPIDLIKVDEFLHQQFLKIEKERIEIAWIVWKNGEDEEPGEEFLLLISASELEIIEEQDKKWNDYFGNEYDNYLNEYKTEMENEKFLSDQSVCRELIDKIDNKNK